MSKNILIIFMKYPTPGQVKTRLIPSFGEKKAADIAKKLAERTVHEARLFIAHYGGTLKIYYKGASEEKMRLWLGEGLFKKQCEGDLGSKMKRAVQENLTSKEKKVILIGTDCPNLGKEMIYKAFYTLQKKDIVVGPTYDGGYYLIGLKKREDSLFSDIHWGGNSVFTATCVKAKEKGITVEILPRLHDIDRPEDVTRFVPL